MKISQLPISEDFAEEMVQKQLPKVLLKILPVINLQKNCLNYHQ